jgi:hypothetical protein
MERDRKSKAAAAKAAAEKLDSDDEREIDRKTYKAREWDKFTDDNAKGSGNTMK